MSNPLFSVTTADGYVVDVRPDSVLARTPATEREISRAQAQVLADALPPMWVDGAGKQLAAIRTFCEQAVT